MQILFFTLFCVLNNLVESAFDWPTGNITLYHSESAYCDPSSFLTRKYKGVLSGFVPVYDINDPKHDTRYN